MWLSFRGSSHSCLPSTWVEGHGGRNSGQREFLLSWQRAQRAENPDIELCPFHCFILFRSSAQEIVSFLFRAGLSTSFMLPGRDLPISQVICKSSQVDREEHSSQSTQGYSSHSTHGSLGFKFSETRTQFISTMQLCCSQSVATPKEMCNVIHSR